MMNPRDYFDRLKPSWGSGLLVLALAFGTGSCDRLFVDVAVPSIQVVSPDPSQVQEDGSIELTVLASSFRDVASVELGGHPLTKSARGEWSTTVELRLGLNRLILQAIDDDGVAGVDTVQLLHLRPEVQIAAMPWNNARGGHTATMLPIGRILLVGGARSTSGESSNRIEVLPPGSTNIIPAPADMQNARLGHTATLLPDGRVLFTGGSRQATISSVLDLVEAPEIYDPANEASVELVVTGDPIRRAFHTASLRSSNGGIIVDLLGGTGDVAYNPSPQLGIRRDLRSFLLRGDTLHALSPAIGPFIELLTGHSQTNLARQPPGTPTRQLVAGAIFGEAGVETHHFILDPRSSLGITFEDVPFPKTLRTEHAAVLFAPGQILRLGGVSSAPSTLSASSDVYEDATSQFYDFPDDGLLRFSARHLHSATNMSDGRILVVGGFDSSGAAIRTIEFITFSQ